MWCFVVIGDDHASETIVLCNHLHWVYTCMFMALCVLFVWAAFLSFLLLRKLVCHVHVHVHMYFHVQKILWYMYMVYIQNYTYIYM